MNEQTTVQALYTKLLRLYPRRFRERLGESMEQTFHDLFREKQKENRRLFSFVFWTFTETAIGILREHRSLILEGDIMQTILANLRWPAIVSFLLIIPFMVMEVVNRRNFNEGFPIVLFITMWLLPLLFMLTATPIVRNIRAENKIIANPVVLVVRVVFLALLIWLWLGVLIDQMPCFLGVPNCD